MNTSTASPQVAASSAPNTPTGTRIATAPGAGLGWAVKDAVAMTGRNLLTMRRVPQVLVFSLVQPVIFTLMFRYVFGGAI